MLSLKVAILLANVFINSSGRVENLDVAGQILVPIVLCEAIEGLVRNIRDVKLMVSNCENIVFQLLKYWVRNSSIGRSSV